MTRIFRAVCALDSFKGSLGSLAAGQAAKRGILAAIPGASVTVFPVADGGEGTLDALMWVGAGQRFDLDLLAADHQTRVTATYGIVETNGHRAAVLESAQAIGISQVTVDGSLPLTASSFGLGTLLIAALDHSPDEILITLGGSATTDGGTGLFQALGAALYDAAGDQIPSDTNPLWHFDHADVSGLRGLSGTQITVLTDVKNPMTGPEGAAATFGPQKGAPPKQVAHLDAQNKKWAKTLEHHFATDISVPGAGAAGGLGGALLALGAHLQPGFERIAKELALADAIAGAALVLTGEGSLDSQSAYGKVPAGVGALAKASGVPVVALAGQATYPLGETANLLDAAFPIHSQPMTTEEALDPDRTAQGIQNTAEQVARLVSSFRTRSHPLTNKEQPHD